MGLLEFQSVFDGKGDFVRNREQYAQMIVGEGVALALVESEHAHRTVDSDEGH